MPYHFRTSANYAVWDCCEQRGACAESGWMLSRQTTITELGIDPDAGAGGAVQSVWPARTGTIPVGSTVSILQLAWLGPQSQCLAPPCPFCKHFSCCPHLLVQFVQPCETAYGAVRQYLSEEATAVCRTRETVPPQDDDAWKAEEARDNGIPLVTPFFPTREDR